MTTYIYLLINWQNLFIKIYKYYIQWFISKVFAAELNVRKKKNKKMKTGF